jgi:hypothetical protein
VNTPLKSLPQRMTGKYYIDETTGCWLWTGALTGSGYARMNHHGKHVTAHRAMYELVVGPVPKGLDLDHLCRMRRCINPAHLEPVTRAENLRRGIQAGVNVINAAKTHCLRGHPLSGDNVRLETTGSRRCRTCERKRRAKKEAS